MKVTVETLTDEVVRALARIDAAECFRSLGTDNKRRIDAVTAALCGDTSRAVGAGVIRRCRELGLATFPAAGQIILTAIGRAALDKAKDAINAASEPCRLCGSPDHKASDAVCARDDS